MTTRPALVSVPVQGLIEYPIDRSERLPELAFVKWVPSRWLNSSGHLKCTYEVQGMARALFDICTAQSPIGTLPDDDEVLAKLLRIDPGHWVAMRAMGTRGPLRNWVHCQAGDEVRLMHAVVTESLLDVLARRETRELSKGRQAEIKRIERLINGLRGAGLSAAVLEDAVLIARMDEWLTANHRGNRTPIAHLRVIEHAARAGWMAAVMR